MNCTFSRNNYKNIRSLNEITLLSRWDSPAKTVYTEKKDPT